MGILLRARRGIPEFARRALAGEEATIVAFGTSVTLAGHYLARLPAALAAETGNPKLRLVTCGLRGFISLWAAFRVRDDVLPHRPDLVLIEFAHNEVVDEAVASSNAAIDPIVAQVREVNPRCEFALVYLAMQGHAAAGPSPAMLAQERAADYYGFPSIDLATLTEDLVAAGTASWSAEDVSAITFDGVHHNPITEELLGAPFAAAFRELLRAPALPGAPVPPVRNRFFSGAWRAPASQYVAGGSWATGVPHNHDFRNAEAYSGEVLEAMDTGAVLRIAFEGRGVSAWLMGMGRLSVTLSGRPEPYTVEVASGHQWTVLPLLPPELAEGSHVVELTVTKRPVIFGDLFVTGTPLGEPKRGGNGPPGVVP